MRLRKDYSPRIDLYTGIVDVPADLVGNIYCYDPRHANNMFEAADGNKEPCDCTNRSGSGAVAYRESFYAKQLQDLEDGTWDRIQNGQRVEIAHQVSREIIEGRDIDMDFASAMMSPVRPNVRQAYIDSASEILDAIRKGPIPVKMRHYFWQKNLKPESHYFGQNSNYMMVFYIRDLTGSHADGTPHSEKPLVFVTPYH